MPGSILGTAVRRIEDPELLTGLGTFVGNLCLEGALHAEFVRSPYAHAQVCSIDISAAAAMPGVVRVFTAADIGLAPMFVFLKLNPLLARPPLATDRVRFVGEAVALVVAETKAMAVDAAAAVDVEYDPLPVVVDPIAALADDAPLQFPELGTNLVVGVNDPSDPVSGAAVVVRGRFMNQRLAVVPMEGNAIAVSPAHGDDPWTIHVSTQMPHLFRTLAAELFSLEEDAIRVVAPHVGGGFGGKAGITTDNAVIMAASRCLDRPLMWWESRSENLVSMWHARAQIQWAELGLDRDGMIRGMRARVLCDAGAYGGFGAAFALPGGPTYQMLEGVYRIPEFSAGSIGVLTNTTPVGGMRGAGRPEATALIERLIDLAAVELDIDPVELRRRNMLRPDEFPYATHTGVLYDTGDYETSLDQAVATADYAENRVEQAARRQRGDRCQLGIGVAAYVEITSPWLTEWASVEVDNCGGATVLAGTSAHGQGHATAFAMLVSDRLGIPMNRITVREGDTAIIPRGQGTGGSRSLQMGGSAVSGAAGLVLDHARKLAAELLEADPGDIVVDDAGRIGVAGVPSSSVTWAELAVAAEGQGEKLHADFDFTTTGQSFPFGCHIALVEVDVETGRAELLRLVAVDDCGRIVNPLIVEGQVHGGCGQGIGQALYEEVRYDDSGNPLTSTLADYAMPSAADLPSLEVSYTETLTPLNPLGAKGIGESGTIGSTVAIQNAVIDAVSHLGVRHIDMPCTPERVWRAVEAARGGAAAPAWQAPPAAFDTLMTPSEMAEMMQGGAAL